MNESKYFSLTHRIAEETQLLAEEKWIDEALKQIKTQRNCLQIERLQLESIKGMLRRTNANRNNDIQLPESPKPPTTFTLNMMQNMSAPKVVVNNTPNRKFLEDEATCNNEELNLGVKNKVFSCPTTDPFPIEEDDEEEEEMDDCDDLHLDMNMFMNCTQKLKE